jgi:8-oxo-dGDP phosphatase
MPEALSDESFPVEVRASDRVFDGAVWDVFRDRFVLGDDVLEREYQKHPGAVAILAEDTEGRILLIKQYRHPIGFRDWELPAGLRDMAGEDPLETAKRELAEEADLVADDWSPLCEFFSSPGGSSEVITVFRARSLSPAAHRFERTEEEAGIELRWVDANEVVAAVLGGRLRNSILAISVLNAHARR